MTGGSEPTLVLGADYFVGTHVARKLADRAGPVRCVTSGGPAPEVVKSFVGSAPEWGTVSLRDPAALEEAMRGCGTVYHCDEDYTTWSPHPEEIYRHNVEGTASVLEAALRAGVDRVVYTSSVGALGRKSGEELATEETPLDPAELVGHYQRSKYRAAQEVEEWVERGAPVVTVNPPASVGELDRDPTPVGGLIVDFLAGRIPAYIDSGRSFVDVGAVAEGHLLAAEHGEVGRRYVLAGHNLTIEEFLSRLGALTGREPPRWQLPWWVAFAYGGLQELRWRLTGREPDVSLENVRTAGDKMFFDDSRARRELGYEPGPLEPALRRAVNWFRREGYVGPVSETGPGPDSVSSRRSSRSGAWR